MEHTGGRWFAQEIAEDKLMNCLKFGLMALCDKEEHVHVHSQLDNVTAVIFINDMGSTYSKPFNKVAQDIWIK